MVKEGIPKGTKIVISYDGDTPFGFGTVLRVKNSRALIMTAGVVEWFDAENIFTIPDESKSSGEESSRTDAEETAQGKENADNEDEDEDGDGDDEIDDEGEESGCCKNSVPSGISIDFHYKNGMYSGEVTGESGKALLLDDRSMEMFGTLSQNFVSSVIELIKLDDAFRKTE